LKRAEHIGHLWLQSICLNLIVKDEASVIERGLASVKPFVTRWVAVDTGAPEGTQRRQV